MVIYTFVHPTKSGGTAVEEYFNSYYSKYIIGKGHDNKCLDNNNPIIIVRDVKSRFISMFKYWKYGSSDTKYKRNIIFKNKNKNKNILDFIYILKTDKEKLYKDFTWSQHFLNTSEWIGKTNYKNIIIIKYVDNLNDKISKLLNFINIENKNIILPKKNISVLPKEEDKILFNHPLVDIFLKIYFKEDIKLLNKINNNPELFKIII